MGYSFLLKYSYQMCQGLSLMFSKQSSCETLTADRASLTSILLAKNRMGILRCLISSGRRYYIIEYSLNVNELVILMQSTKIEKKKVSSCSAAEQFTQQ